MYVRGHMGLFSSLCIVCIRTYTYRYGIWIEVWLLEDILCIRTGLFYSLTSIIEGE